MILAMFCGNGMQGVGSLAAASAVRGRRTSSQSAVPCRQSNEGELTYVDLMMIDLCSGCAGSEGSRRFGARLTECRNAGLCRQGKMPAK